MNNTKTDPPPSTEQAIEEIRRVVAMTYDEVALLRSRVEELSNSQGSEIRDVKHRVRLLERERDEEHPPGNGAGE